jgi:hypothetical protein
LLMFLNINKWLTLTWENGIFFISYKHKFNNTCSHLSKNKTKLTVNKFTHIYIIIIEVTNSRVHVIIQLQISIFYSDDKSVQKQWGSNLLFINTRKFQRNWLFLSKICATSCMYVTPKIQ